MAYQTPGVHYQQEVLFPQAPPRNGVPVFLGLTERSPSRSFEPDAFALKKWSEFTQLFGAPRQGSYLGQAVHGFFSNGGSLCYVYPVEPIELNNLRETLAILTSWDSVDLVCAPDIVSGQLSGTVRPDLASIHAMQRELLKHCEELGDRFAILDAAEPGLDTLAILEQRKALLQGQDGKSGALYYPWLQVPSSGSVPSLTLNIPPCGHIAGIYASSDKASGVHKAPGNEPLQQVLGITRLLNNNDQKQLNTEGINCIRSIPGRRSICMWGVRTLSADPVWRYINVRRLFISVGRWVERYMEKIVFEPNNPTLWKQISRELTVYFTGLFNQGALKGQSAREAFFVKCDEETNPLSIRETGKLITLIGLAPLLPSEFIVIRVLQDASGVRLTQETAYS